METAPSLQISADANARVARMDGVNSSNAEDFIQQQKFGGSQQNALPVSAPPNLSNSEQRHIPSPQGGAGLAAGRQESSERNSGTETRSESTGKTASNSTQKADRASAPTNCSEQIRVSKEGRRDVMDVHEASNKATPLSAETPETPNAAGLESGSSLAPESLNSTGHAQTAHVPEESSNGSPALDSGPPAESEPSPEETAAISELVHSADSQEIVVVSEAGHLGAAWSNVHLKQSYLLQRADGSVCEAAIVTEHAPAEAKLYEESVGAHVDLETQNVEVYQFCGLVEEVAEETVCVSTSVQIPHSPGYEVNLFNALLDSSEDLESQLEPALHAIADADTVIISQQEDDEVREQVCPGNNVRGLSVAAVGQHLLLDSSNRVCLLEVDSFPAEQTSAQVLSACPRVSEDGLPAKCQRAGVSDATPEARVSPPAGTKEPPGPDPAQRASVSTGARQEAFIAQTVGGNNPKLLLIQPGSLLKRATSLFKQNADSKSGERLAVDPSPAATSGTKPGGGQTAAASRRNQSEASNAVGTSNPTAGGFEESAVDLAGRHDSPFDEEEDGEEEEEEEDNVSGQVSEEDGSEGEGSEEYVETAGKNTPSSTRKWRADGVSPSTSSAFMEPSPGSDWAGSPHDKSSPIRGPHGKFVSPTSLGSLGGSMLSPSDHSTPQRQRGERRSDMAELAKHEADIENRSQALKREGYWSTKRLNRLAEPPKPKVHWDYLCEEMQWLSADFAQERRWKRGVARKVVRMVMRHHEEVRQKEEKAKRDEHAKIRRVASSIAKEVRAFWSSVEKVVQYKQQSRLEEKRKKALDLQLDFIVGQTEKYSDLLSQSLAPASRTESVPSPSKTSSVPTNADEEDRDFEPPCEEDDDEETIEVEEQQEGNDAESRRREIELLKEESTLPLDQLLSTLQQPRESVPDEEGAQESSSSEDQEEEDGEFAANEEDAEDEEYTIAAQEKVEGNMDHAEELDDLAKEGDMSMEELLEKYKGAYASDVEEASASAPASKASSEWEASGDEEDDSDEEDSDLESNTSSSASPRESDEEENSQKDGSEEEEEEEGADEGMEVLLKEGGDHSPSSSSASRPKKEISHIAATAESLQPKGYTLATTKVKTPIPFLLHGTLREYQHIGLDWLVTMFEKKLNGILADEMGLGKTIQTIALLAHLACEKNNWGPHLIIVPTSVMLNWEMELKRWCPGFKILTYFGSQKERKLKRQGWTKPNAFHVCITSYKLVLQDHQAFRRKSWRYLILDEAQNIKNFKSQRWQSLLNFNSHRRLLLTGTPLQNSLMELWSLMHFLMPHVFQSHREFKEWFSNPLTGMIEGSQEYNEGLVKRLHKVLRPFLLRRIKADVEKQMPKKYEHVVRCRLSKRQRFLYDDFMAQASTKETLASGHFMSVINILMQLRKVCNHPNLFDPRPIQSPFITKPIVFRTASLVLDALEVTPMKRCDLSMFDLVGLEGRVSRYQADVFVPKHKVSRQLIEEIVESPEPLPRPRAIRMKVNRMTHPPPKGDTRTVVSKASSSVPPATQTSKPPSPEVPTPPSVSTPAPVPPPAPAPVPMPVVQQVVCSVTTAPPPRTALPPGAQTAVRSSVPKHVLTVRPPPPPPASCTTGIPVHPPPNPGSIMPQRVLLSPDMQARLPSGEVVSIAQLASLAGRPISSCQGSKPVTFQLQGNKLTLSGAPIRPAPPRRPVQANVMHLLSSGGQHHLISQPAQVTVQNPGAAHRLPLGASTQVTASSVVSTPGVVKIVVRQAAGKEGSPVPTLAVAPSPRAPSSHPHPNATPVRSVAPLQVAQRTPGPATAHYTLAPPRIPSSTSNQAPPPVPILKIVQAPPPRTEQPAPAEATASCSTSKPAAHEGTSKDTTVTIPASTPSAAATATTTATATATASTSQTPAVTKAKAGPPAKPQPPVKMRPRPIPRSPFYTPSLAEALKKQRDSKLDFIFRVNERHSGAKPVFGKEVLDFLTFLPGPRPTPAAPRVAEAEWGRSGHAGCLVSQWRHRLDLWRHSRPAGKAIHSVEERLTLLSDIVDRFTFAIPPVEASRVTMHCCHPPPSLSHQEALFSSALSTRVAPLTRSLHRIQCSMRTQFPDLRLIQYDCGKLQTLHLLLRNLKTGGHRVLIFTQMTRMLDILEQFLNYHGHIYLRLDGSTRVEQRQALMERFNADRRIFCFILSTRSGGVGVNLTGADTVVFYDSDWNPTMDAQAQDRCHRIGQTRDVHIYRLISERTVEENILKKANQKRMLGDMAIEGGNFTTAFFKEQTIRDLFDVNESEKKEPAAVEVSVPQVEDEEASNKQSTTILEQALCRAEDEEDIVAASQAKAEQVAELAEFNENIPLDDAGEQEDVEELSKAEQEIAALVEQLTPIERYAMNFLEASLEDVCKEELKQAEEQVEAARKGLDQAKEGGLKLHASSDEDDVRSAQASAEAAQPAPARRGRKPKPKDKAKAAPSTRISGRLRGASPEMEPEAPPPREVPERARAGLRGRAAAAKESGAPSVADPPKIPAAAIQVQDPSWCSKDSSSTAGDQQAVKPRASPAAAASSPSPSTSPPGAAETDNKTPKRGKEESPRPAERQAKDEETKDQSAMSPPPTSCRSPRKRQSADGEVLKGHVEDSTSAKVLRKLPGRLVTVVEEKEPRKKRWRGGGAGASWEEAPVVEENSGEDGTKDARPPTGDGASTDAAAKSCQDQDSGPNPAAGNFQPVRAYPPYSPPHLSPDMPVLRNLPVRRRLETESRMAAQLSEQLQLLRGKNQHKKSEKESSPASTEGNANSPETPTKRKRGRPPKCPLNAASPPLPPLPPPLATQPVSPGEDGSLSPKRKRGRPRKDSASSPDFAFDGQKPAKESSGESNPDVGEDPSTSEDKTTPRDRLPAKTEGTDSSKPAESEVATANPNQISYPISTEDTAEPRVASPNPLTSFSSSQQVPTALNSEPSSQPVGSFSPPPPAPDLSRPSEASAERHSGRSAIGAPSADGSPSPPASEKDGKDQIGELPVEPSAASPLPTNTTPSMEAPSKKSDPVKSEPVPPDTARQTSSLAFTTTPGDPSKSAAFSEDQTGVASPNDVPQPVTPSSSTSRSSPAEAPKTNARTVENASEASPKESKKTPATLTSNPRSSEEEADRTNHTEADKVEMDQDAHSDTKRRKVEISAEKKEKPLAKCDSRPEWDIKPPAEETPTRKRSLSRQSSQDSARSSSPSSGCSTSTLTRHAHHKRTYENRHPTKKRRVDVTSGEATAEGKPDEDGRQKERSSASGSSSSSCDSDNDKRGKSRGSRGRSRDPDRSQDPVREPGGRRRGKKHAPGSDANASTGGDSGSDSSSARMGRVAAGSSPSPGGHTPPRPPEPEVLGKRCSALNAAAKLLAMKGRVDTPGHTPRKDPAAKTAANAAAGAAAPDTKPQSKKLPLSPPNNSVGKTKVERKPSPALKESRPASRSTRQCPGSLVPPLVGPEYKRCKSEGAKAKEAARGDGEAQRPEDGKSDGGNDLGAGGGTGGGKVDGGGDLGTDRKPARGSRSRSSSDSSRRAHSVSSQNAERKGAGSRAASSGSDRDRSAERGGKTRKGPRGAHRPIQESAAATATTTPGAEGTANRVLRSVAAAAAVQARSPAASTRSSANQQRHNKT